MLLTQTLSCQKSKFLMNMQDDDDNIDGECGKHERSWKPEIVRFPLGVRVVGDVVSQRIDNLVL